MFLLISILTPAILLLQNTRKRSRNAKNEKFIAGISCHFFRISHQGGPSRKNSKGFRDLFFCGVNKTQKSHEMWKVYSECFVFRGVLWKHSQNTKYKKCIAGLKVLGWPLYGMSSALFLLAVNLVPSEHCSLCQCFIAIRLLYQVVRSSCWLSQMTAEFDCIPLFHF